MTITTHVVDPLGPEGAVASAIARNVEPFTTSVLGYDTVVLSWTSPAVGSWLGIQIVRSRSGFPRTPDDGLSVLTFEQPGWNETNSFTLTGLVGGYHYFSLFLKDAFGWQRVSEADALVPYDYSSTDRMWDTLPEYYRVVRDDTADISKVNLRINPDLYDGVAGGEQPNLLLSAFISLFGWGFDLLRTQAEYLANGYDPLVIHSSRLRLLSEQFGHTLETSVPAHVNRTIVRNLATLYRKRGTLDGIHDMIAAVSGWEVEVSLGPNMLLSEDQSGHVNPVVPTWDPTVKYLGGWPVKYGDYVFEAKSGGSLNQTPPATGTSNAYWNYYASPITALGVRRADTFDINTWQVRLATGGATQGLTYQMVGAQDITGTKRHTNALRTHTNTAQAWYEVESIPFLTTPARSAQASVLEAGIPIPRPAQWRADRVYRAGEFAIYKGAAYEALNDVIGVLPTVAADWLRVGADDRIAFTSSMYAHGPFEGTSGTGGKTITPKVYEYDGTGTLARSFEWTSGSAAVLPYFDPFVEDNAFIVGGRVSATGQSWLDDTAGNWPISRDDNGGWVAVGAAGKSHRWFNTSYANPNLAVTWTADPGTTRLVGIVFRRSDTNNFWIATQTGLYKVVAGAARANPASGALTWTKFVAGERMRVFANGSSISVYRNGTLLGTATDSFNSTATQHGLGAEA
jgi:hypothetical protein